MTSLEWRVFDMRIGGYSYRAIGADIGRHPAQARRIYRRALRRLGIPDWWAKSRPESC